MTCSTEISLYQASRNHTSWGTHGSCNSPCSTRTCFKLPSFRGRIMIYTSGEATPLRLYSRGANHEKPRTALCYKKDTIRIK